jgi:hypothetical protein
MKTKHLVILTLITTISVSTAIADDAVVDYPSDYRSWQHVKSMLIQPGHALEDPFGGIHHVYANSKAMKGLSSGEYDEGAGFVFDLLSYKDSDLLIVETGRLRIDVMQYNKEKFSKTGGWGYETFVGDSSTERLDQDVVTACYGCHIPAKETNYVYSKYRP